MVAVNKIVFLIMLLIICQFPQSAFAVDVENMFNKDTAVENYIVNDYTGVLNYDTNYYTSDYIPVKAGTQYIMTTGYYMAFYNTSRTYISGAAGFGYSNYVVTAPSNAAYIRLSVYKSKIDTFIFDCKNKGYERLKNAVIVNFGDSIFGGCQDETSVSSRIGYLTGATVYNIGFGGCRMSTHIDNTWSAFSMYNIADAIVNNNYTSQDTAIAAQDPSMPYYFALTLATLKTIDFNKVDYITIGYGNNDYTAGKSIDNPLNKFDVNTYKGALRYSLEKIMGAYPHLKILVITPTYQFWMDSNGEFVEDSDTKLYGGIAVNAFVDATKAVAKEYKTPCLDNYYELGINKGNRREYFPVNDGTHHNANGRFKIAKKICGALTSQF